MWHSGQYYMDLRINDASLSMSLTRSATGVKQTIWQSYSSIIQMVKREPWSEWSI